MTILLVLLLTVLWGAVIVPAVLRARKDTSPIVSVGTFQKGMLALSASQTAGSGRWIVMPARPHDEQVRRRRAVERRRRIFTALLVMAGLTLAASFVPALQWLLWIHFAVDALLVAFVGFLIQLKQRSTSGALGARDLAKVEQLPVSGEQSRLDRTEESLLSASI